MPSQFDDLFESYARPHFIRIFAQAITLRRADLEHQCEGILGEIENSETDAGGQTEIVTRNTVWSIQPSVYRVDGVPVSPNIRDEIETADGRVFRVQSVDGWVWRFSDHQKSYFEINAVEIL